jgi:FHA domain/Bacterial Ig domain
LALECERPLACSLAGAGCGETETMSFVKLIIIQPGHASRELKIESEVVTIGRALDNIIALADDSNVSRYHAEIERRGDSFWVIELGSINGTTVNDQPVDTDRRLENGDLICPGGSTMIEFRLSDIPWEAQEQRHQEAPPDQSRIAAAARPTVNVSGAAASELADAGTLGQPPLTATQPATGLSPLYIIGAIGGGLLLTGVVGVIVFVSSARACKATVRITSPQTGTTLKGPIPIRVEAEETKCIDRVIYELDGVKVASSEIAPYQAMLDPADLSGLTPGNHVLTVTVEDDQGNRNVQPDEVVLGFEKAQIKTSESNEGPGSSSSQTSDRQTSDQRQSLSAADIKDMSERLIKELTSKREYILDREMLHQIEARTPDYVGPGFSSRARPFRDVINDSFINEQGLEPPLGYILAMSRSNFSLSSNRSVASTEGEGLWRVPLKLAQDAGYLGRCGTTTLSDQNQKCAAMVTAAYMKAIEVDLFGGDPLYAVACFGMAPKEAAQWRDQLPADRRDLWNVIKSAEQRERLTRFFAAGIVGENPQQFGLATDSPLSNLYPKK